MDMKVSQPSSTIGYVSFHHATDCGMFDAGCLRNCQRTVHDIPLVFLVIPDCCIHCSLPHRSPNWRLAMLVVSTKGSTWKTKNWSRTLCIFNDAGTPMLRKTHSLEKLNAYMDKGFSWWTLVAVSQENEIKRSLLSNPTKKTPGSFLKAISLGTSNVWLGWLHPNALLGSYCFEYHWTTPPTSHPWYHSRKYFAVYTLVRFSSKPLWGMFQICFPPQIILFQRKKWCFD